ncbi:MAG: LysR family transcriptional regulator [Gammaproteobacteria bacterium]|nr:LysR family transcriptional regulator [Gammaproteobacteria bacterium]MBQ0841045.1 LysR family transcriptional regulator [Gammaproteobacteria bacterium]
MNLRDLDYLLALSEEKNFRKAAERCHVSQPTLSAQIKKLEEYLGVQLIERHHKGLLLTEAGEEAVKHARLVQEQVSQIKTMAERFKDPFSGSLRLGLIPTISPYLLPRIIKPIKQGFPRLSLALHEAQTHELLDLLRTSKLDLLVLALPVSDSLEGLAQLPLYDEAFYLAAHRSREITKKSEIAYSDLDTSQLALLAEGHCLREHALEICQLSKGQAINAFTATSLETLRYMVEADEVMTLMPEMAMQLSVMKHSQIRYVPFKAPVPSRQVGLVYRRATQRHELFTAIQQTIASCCRA